MSFQKFKMNTTYTIYDKQLYFECTITSNNIYLKHYTTKQSLRHQIIQQYDSPGIHTQETPYFCVHKTVKAQTKFKKHGTHISQKLHQKDRQRLTAWTGTWLCTCLVVRTVFFMLRRNHSRLCCRSPTSIDMMNVANC